MTQTNSPLDPQKNQGRRLLDHNSLPIPPRFTIGGAWQSVKKHPIWSFLAVLVIIALGYSALSNAARQALMDVRDVVGWGGDPIGGASTNISSIETPVRFADFVALPPSERTALLDRYRGKTTVWEGLVFATVGFEPGSLHLPLEIPVTVRIAPARGTFAQITADCQFGALEPTDSGIESAMRLHLLSIGQRVRISGALDGDCDSPILSNAFLEAEWPLSE